MLLVHLTHVFDNLLLFNNNQTVDDGRSKSRLSGHDYIYHRSFTSKTFHNFSVEFPLRYNIHNCILNGWNTFMKLKGYPFDLI